MVLQQQIYQQGFGNINSFVGAPLTMYPATVPILTMPVVPLNSNGYTRSLTSSVYHQQQQQKQTAFPILVDAPQQTVISPVFPTAGSAVRTTVAHQYHGFSPALPRALSFHVQQQQTLTFQTFQQQQQTGHQETMPPPSQALVLLQQQVHQEEHNQATHQLALCSPLQTNAESMATDANNRSNKTTVLNDANSPAALMMMNGGPCHHCYRLNRSGSVAGSSKSGVDSATNSPQQPKCIPKIGDTLKELNVSENCEAEEATNDTSTQETSKQKTSGSATNSAYPHSPESPSHHSSNGSEDESVDSGRETGGPLTYSSPFDQDTAVVQSDFNHAMYEFEIPNSLVGLIIGIGGKTIKELCLRADVRMLIRPHHTVTKFDNHQICSIQGRRENINKCLHMIRYRFPPCRFPALNLKPVIPPPMTPPALDTMQSTALNLPIGVPCEAYISAAIDAGHFFVQLPTHPSFSSLAILDQYMLGVYSQPAGAPEVPRPCGVGVLCAAPAYNGWFRAITLAYEEECDETLVRFVDYGGFAKVPRVDLRQIRTDFISLPLQAIECYLGNVQPIDGKNWCDQANELITMLAVGKMIQVELIGYNHADGMPVVELVALDESNQTTRVDKLLLDKGFAQQSDPSLTVRLPKFSVTSPQQQAEQQ